LEINKRAVFTVKSGSTLQVKAGANLIINGSGKVEIENGGYLCIEKDANIVMKDSRSTINLRSGYVLGTNERVIPGSVTFYPKPSAIEFSGKGSVNARDSGIEE
jgi:hypothetical protein